jgi:hypothetical protein
VRLTGWSFITGFAADRPCAMMTGRLAIVAKTEQSAWAAQAGTCDA